MKRDALHRPGDPRRRAGGFTLIEILLAILVGAALLTTAVTFALSMTELWGNGSEVRLFDQHVRGVSRFLENLLRQAELPPAESEGGVEQAQQEAQAPAESNSPVVWQTPRGHDFTRDELLTFEVPESPGVLPWPEHPLPFVVCALRLDPREGLFLLWKSRLELDFEDASPRQMRLSPFVTGMEYFYYETTGAKPSWDDREQPRVGRNREREVPQRVRLTFAYHGEERKVDLVLPGNPAGAPLY